MQKNVFIPFILLFLNFNFSAFAMQQQQQQQQVQNFENNAMRVARNAVIQDAIQDATRDALYDVASIGTLALMDSVGFRAGSTLATAAAGFASSVFVSGITETMLQEMCKKDPALINHPTRQQFLALALGVTNGLGLTFNPLRNIQTPIDGVIKNHAFIKAGVGYICCWPTWVLGKYIIKNA